MNMGVHSSPSKAAVLAAAAEVAGAPLSSSKLHLGTPAGLERAAAPWAAVARQDGAAAPSAGSPASSPPGSLPLPLTLEDAIDAVADAGQPAGSRREAAAQQQQQPASAPAFWSGRRAGRTQRAGALGGDTAGSDRTPPSFTTPPSTASPGRAGGSLRTLGASHDPLSLATAEAAAVLARVRAAAGAAVGGPGGSSSGLPPTARAALLGALPLDEHGGALFNPCIVLLMATALGGAGPEGESASDPVPVDLTPPGAPPPTQRRRVQRLAEVAAMARAAALLHGRADAAGLLMGGWLGEPAMVGAPPAPPAPRLAAQW